MPKQSKGPNSKNPNWGGARKNSGNISNQERQRRAEETKRKYEAYKQSQADMKRRQKEEQERMAQERSQRLHDREQNAINKLREMAQEYEQAAFVESDSQEEVGDDDEDIGFYLDNTDDSEVDQVTKAKREYCNRSFMPGADSALGKVMKKFKEQMVKEYRSDKSSKAFGPDNRKKLWQTFSVEDPVARCCNGYSPNKLEYYQSKFVPFVWKPTVQFGSAVNMKEISCIKCNAVGKGHLHGLTYRPMFNFDKIVWVLHDRIHCKACKKTFTTIDAGFLNQLPTRIVERFPFIVPMRGPGVHEMMIYHFVSLNLKQTGFASYVDSINQLQRLHHTKDALSYYDCISLRKQSLFCTDAIYEPFSSFYDTNEYNGIKLRRHSQQLMLDS